jgi:arylsulfatase A-like enzyme
VHYFDPHLPYAATPPFADTFSAGLDTQLDTPVSAPQKVRAEARHITDRDRRYLEAVYDEEIRLADAGLGQLLAGLEERGLVDRTLLVVTSDHGEELFDHGGFEHGHALHHELVHVPLLLRAPGWVEPGRVAAPVSLRDVHATILEAALPGEESAGRSLAGRGGEGAASPILLESMLYGHDRLGLIDGPWKWTRGARGDELLYDLSRDPREQQPLDVNGVHAERAQRMRAKAESMRDAARAARPEREDRALDDETRLQLGVLGYLEES